MKGKKSWRKVRAAHRAEKPMKKVMRNLSKTIGKPAGTLQHIGEQKTDFPSITVFGYDEDHEFHMPLKSIAECAALKDKEKVLWVNIDGLHDVSVIEAVGKLFDIHPLTLEDILHTEQRSKIEDFERYLFLVFKALDYDPQTGEISEEQMSLVIGSNFVLTFQEKPGDMFDALRARIINPGTPIRKRGADYLAYGLIDAIVDSYFVILEQLESRIELLDQELFETSGRDTFESIYGLKKELILLRKSVRPMREIINSISREHYTVIDDKATWPFFRDVYDNVIFINETIETYRDIVIGMYDTWLAIVNNRMNEIMKVLTTIATVFMPLSFLTGVYGMNFRFMPGLEWHWGFFALLGFMGMVVSGMMVYFRTRKWF
ncbi:MAG: magnesium/cobalt transporter CorA [Chlorobiales bacterium]|nr:magnesium/cobalt transporter CorA [Chlorobiales bacterium]